MPDTERKRLEWHKSRDAGLAASPRGDWGAVLFGFPFAGFGLVQLLMAWGTLPAARNEVPSWILGAMGLVFLIPGLAFMAVGAAGRLRRSQAVDRAVRRPDQPWPADYPWDPDGIDDDPRPYLALVGWTLFLALLSSPFNYFAWTETGGLGWFVVFAVVLDGVVAAMLVRALVHAFHELKYGRSRLTFARFPFFLGQAFEAQLHPRSSLRRHAKLTLTLRCVEELLEEGDEGGYSIACYQIWADTQELPGGEWSHRREPPLLRFDLPPEADYGTQLDLRTPRYWELTVRADTPGLDYAATFLVPVYARPT